MERVERYDAIVLGTGFTECLVASLLSRDGKKVLQIDREKFSGGANGSISSLEELQEKFRSNFNTQKRGEWNVDLTPKFFIGNDKLSKLLKTLGVKVNAKPLQNIFTSKRSQLIKVPCTVSQVDKIATMSKQEKEAFKRLIEFVKSRNQESLSEEEDTFLNRFNINENSKLIIRHGMFCGLAKYSPCEEMLDRIQRFCDVTHYQATAVTFPLFGLGEITQALLKRMTSQGGRFMLNRPVNSVKKSGGMVFISARGISAMANVVVGDPSYFMSNVRPAGKAVRAICITDHAVAGTESSGSCYISIPGCELGRQNDINICVVGSEHNLVPAGFYIAHVCTLSETSEPEQEIEAGLDVVGKTLAKYITVDELYEPGEAITENKIFVSSSYGSEMNWDSIVDNAIAIYEKISGKRVTGLDVNNITK